MANQKIPTTDTVEDVTVEKIILSGSQFVSSVLGHGAHLIIADSVPLFYTDPVISGSVIPPSVLTCDEGSFNSSPRATLTYQWKRDAGNITDETSNTYTTVLSDIDTEITCEVTITNGSGNDTGLSNGLTMEAIIPSDVFELGIYTITGLSSLGRMDVNDYDMCIIAGIQHDDKIDINELCVQAITGVAVDVIESVNEVGAYAMFVPTSLTPLVVLNHDAEDSDMSDWTMDINTVESVTTALGDDLVSFRDGARFFHPEQLGQGVDSQMSQVIDIPSDDYTDVDTGRCYCIARFLLHTHTQLFDSIVVTLEALNAADGVLNTAVHTTPLPLINKWRRSSTDDNPLSLPTLTRKVKITILFDASSSGSANVSAYMDDITIELMKIE